MRKRTSNKGGLIGGRFLTLFVVFFHAYGLAQDPVICDSENRLTHGKVQQILKQWPLRNSDSVTSYIRSLGSRLAEQSHIVLDVRWYFNVVRDHSPNAFAVGNGYIYITEGAIKFCNDEGELAAILAHEIGHQLSGHFCRPSNRISDRDRRRRFNKSDSARSKIQRTRSIGSFSQVLNVEKEAEADRFAVQLLQTSGYNPHGMLAVAERLPTRGSSFSHWGNQQRISTLKRLLSPIPKKETQASPEFERIKKLVR